ncbi:MAG: FAD:protein FMN transferase [Deltaproteobacteria bacterium]|nr:MAG: FAD:protein FMN transferase [Deltaproteobacteria bacterium]
MHIKKLSIPIFIFVLVMTVGFQPTAALAGRQEIQIAGRTMGTVYHVKVISAGESDGGILKAAIENRLIRINRSMSTFIPDSEISRFNALKQTGNPFAVSSDFMAVVTLARTLYRLTGGAWDGTIAPLVDLWGFGSTGATDQVPAPQTVSALLTRVGFDMIGIGPGDHLVKKNAAVTLDLASVAKGYAVDAVSRLIATKGYRDYLVEIGGEVFAAGRRADGRPWRVGINRPDRSAAFNAVYKAIDLSNRALATSGDYRNYFEADGRYYGHILDPRTGYPVTNGVVSVSVTADTCALADGLATGIMVLGVEKGLALVNGLDHVECLIVVRDSGGRLIDHQSGAFLPE